MMVFSAEMQNMEEGQDIPGNLEMVSVIEECSTDVNLTTEEEVARNTVLSFILNANLDLATLGAVSVGPATLICRALGMNGGFDLSCAKYIKLDSPHFANCPAGK